LKSVQIDQFRFDYFILKIKIQLIGFGSIRIGFGVVRFGLVRLFYIKTQKLYCFFFWFFGFSNEFGSIFFGLTFQFQAYKTETELNKIFFNIF